MGVNIPLWSNANKVKQSRAKIAAAESRKAAAEQQFYFDLLVQYNRAASLKENSELMRASLSETDSRDYLLTAQSRGEISMIEYLVETDQYYEALEQTLAAEPRLPSGTRPAERCGALACFSRCTATNLAHRHLTLRSCSNSSRGT